MTSNIVINPSRLAKTIILKATLVVQVPGTFWELTPFFKWISQWINQVFLERLIRPEKNCTSNKNHLTTIKTKAITLTSLFQYFSILCYNQNFKNDNELAWIDFDCLFRRTKKKTLVLIVNNDPSLNTIQTSYLTNIAKGVFTLFGPNQLKKISCCVLVCSLRFNALDEGLFSEHQRKNFINFIIIYRWFSFSRVKMNISRWCDIKVK